MAVEKLTDEERAALLNASTLYNLTRKALGLLDAATSKRDAQAAVIERVRAEIQTCETEAERRDPEDESHIQADGYRHIRAMLAAAPEHTVTHLECRLCGDPLDADHPKGPCVPCHELPEKDAAPEHTAPDPGLPYCERCKALAGARCGICSAAKYEDMRVRRNSAYEEAEQANAERDAANARVAELERHLALERKSNENREADIERLEEALAAANARADAPERENVANERRARAFEAGATKLQAERDEWKAKCEAAELRAEVAEAAEMGVRSRAEAEAAALRAELADQIKLANGALDAQGEAEQKWFAARARISAATELLARASGFVPVTCIEWHRAHGAFLSTAPAPTEAE